MTLPVGVTLSEGAPLEQLRIVTPLGIRFRDVALDQAITHGLIVLVRAKQFDGGETQLHPSPSGVFGFHSLPLLHETEYPFPLAGPLPSPPATLPFVVMVSDRLGRFLPSVFGIELPLLTLPSPPVLDIDPDPAPVLDAYLFSAPTRPVSRGFAAIRATLWDREKGAAAAHALVRVTLGGQTARGIADEQGRVLILLPYPLLERLRLGSPPGTGQHPPYEHSWPVSVEVSYRPDLPRPLGGTGVLPAPWTRLPGLKAIIESQDPVWIWPAPAGPPATTWSGTLTYDHELVVRTQIVSELWITRGASPP
jgi:hypothetical protein